METQSPEVTGISTTIDLLQQFAIVVPCMTCHQHYTVTLRDVLASQGLLHDGCPVCSNTECPPLTYATLADEASVREFEQSWLRLLHSVRTAGYEVTIRA